MSTAPHPYLAPSRVRPLKVGCRRGSDFPLFLALAALSILAIGALIAVTPAP